MKKSYPKPGDTAAWMKRAKEKKKKIAATEGAYKKTKSRNLYIVPIEFCNRVLASADETFEKMSAGKYRKKYA